MKYMIEPMYVWDGYSNHADTDTIILVENEKVLFVGKKALCKEKDIQCIKGDWIILPGFINAHDHGRAVSPIGYGVKDQCLELWLPELYKLPAINHETACYYDGLKLLSSGVTTVLHSHNPNSWKRLKKEIAQSAKGYGKAGIRSILCVPYLDQNKGIYYGREEFIQTLPTALGKQFRNGITDQVFSVEEYLEIITDLRKELSAEIENGMVEIQLHPNGGQWCSDEALLKMKEYALQYDVRIHMHLLETKYQSIYANKTWKRSFLQHYEDISFLGPWLSCAHMIWLSEEDMELLNKYQVMAVTNPSSNIRLRSGVFPLRRLAEKRVTVGIGLDGCGFDDDQDYLREMRTAYYNNEVVGVDGEVDENLILRMATSMGAGIANNRLSPGVIQAEADADFVCISVNDLKKPYADEECDILDLLIHRGTRECVDTVFIKGKRVFENKNECHELIREAEAILTSEIQKAREKEAWKELEYKKEISKAIYKFYKEWECERK